MMTINFNPKALLTATGNAGILEGLVVDLIIPRLVPTKLSAAKLARTRYTGVVPVKPAIVRNENGNRTTVKAGSIIQIEMLTL